MSVYITSLFIAIPSFIILIILEIIVSRIKGIEVNNHADMISSLSSGLTNTIQASLKFGFVIISYSWLVDKITLFKLEPLWIAVLLAFIVEDFAGYWMHRLNHRVNIFWNRHVIHHSSEEFNLSCALRQSISTTFRFSAILMIPAALLGIPASIFAVLGPIHLFIILDNQSNLLNYLYASILFLNIFTFTASLDKKEYTIKVEILKFIFVLLTLYYQQYSWFGLDTIYSSIIFAYFLISFLATYYFNRKDFISSEILIAKD
jgi:sterol desaturase/sphingolipid hydroxylase (fatty acid hydroxylase superfamily)